MESRADPLSPVCRNLPARSDAGLNDFFTLARALSAAQTPREAGVIIVDVAQQLLGWDSCSLDLYSPEADLIHNALVMDTLDDLPVVVGEAYETGAPSPIARRTIDEGPQLILRDLEAGSGDGTPMRAFGDRSRRSASLIFVPVRNGDRITGILSIQSYTPYCYNEADLQLLQALADQCGGALERIRIAEELRNNELLLRRMIESSADAIITLTQDGTLLSISSAGRDVLGLELTHEPRDWRWLDFWNEAHRPQAFSALVEALGGGKGQFLAPRNVEGGVRWLDVVLTPIPGSDSQPERLLAVARDVTEREEALERLKAYMRQAEEARERAEYDALHDSLTGLPNRTLFQEQLAQAIAKGAREGAPAALLLVDLDRFKEINDTFGHAFGDAILQRLRPRLESAAGTGTTVARLGGDEFAVVLPAADEGAAVSAAQRVLSAIQRPFSLDACRLRIGASIGIAIYPNHGSDSSALLRQADLAMYRAKRHGGGFAVYNAASDGRRAWPSQVQSWSRSGSHERTGGRRPVRQVSTK